MPPKICLRRAKPSDLPAMLRTFIAAFSHGPWSGVLFPPHLRTSPNDEMNWRTRVAASALQQPGQTYMIAEEEEQGGQLVGWAQWTDAAARDASEKMTKEERWGSDAPPGLDLQAAEALGGEAEVVEEMVRGALGKERWGRAVELHYLVIDPAHQRQGIGRLLVQEGLDRIAGQMSNRSDVWLRSTADGRKLYLACGFKEVGEGAVFGQGQWAMVRRGERASG